MVTIKAKILIINPAHPEADLATVYTATAETLDDARVAIQKQLDALFPNATRIILRRLNEEDEEGQRMIWMP